jgi:hypothetical protein
MNCKGCGKDIAFLPGHTRDCEYTDDAGNPVELTVKWSTTRWHIATTTPAELLRLHGGHVPPVEDLLGGLEDDDPLAEYLTRLEAHASHKVAMTDGYDIGDIYAASRDHVAGASE